MSRKFLIGIAIAAGAATVALVVLPFVMDASKGGMVLADVTAIGTLILVGLAVVDLRRGSTEGKGGRRVMARGRGALAAGRSITGNATGKGAKAIGRIVPTPESAGADSEHQVVEAQGTGAMAAGQDISGNATGDDSEAS